MKTLSLLTIILLLTGCYAQKFPKPIYDYASEKGLKIGEDMPYHIPGGINFWSTRTGPSPISEEELKTLLKVSDKVLITLQDGSRVEFRITLIQDVQMRGSNGERVNFAEVKMIRIKKISAAKSIGLGLGVVLFAGAVITFFADFAI